MGKTDFIVSVLLFLCGIASGQVVSLDDTVALSGVVMNARNLEKIPDATCRFGGNKGTVSDEEGYFRLRTRRGDTVVFSCVGFKPCRVILADTLSLYGKEYAIGVFMSPDTLMLSEALVVGRWKNARRQDRINARNNMRGLLEHAYAPKDMDADMNQRMMVGEFARRVEMKGHVDVKFSVGTSSVDACRWLRMHRHLGEKGEEWLDPEEVDLLKKLYYLEKRGKGR